MNMKPLFALTALTAAGAASAAVTSGNTLCRIEIASGTKNTIVAVPLVKVGSGDAIPANELVLTDNLSEGDTLLHWNATESKWDSWEVKSGVWTPELVNQNNNTQLSSEATNVLLTRGDAVWVERTQVKGSFYIYGQVASGSVTMPAITRSGSADTYIMMGNTNLQDVAIGSLTFNGTPAEGDKISVPVNTGLGVKEYTYKGSKWTQVGWSLDANGVLTPEVTETTAKIPAGQGFWYVAKQSSPAQQGE